MTLRLLALQHGRSLGRIGLPPGTAYPISAGILKASATSIARIAAALQVDAAIVETACNASWATRHPPTATAADPGLSSDRGAVHATEPSAAEQA